MKKPLSLLLTVALMLTLAACGSTAGQGGTNSNPALEGSTPASTPPEIPPASQSEDTTPPEHETPAESAPAPRTSILWPAVPLGWTGSGSAADVSAKV